MAKSIVLSDVDFAEAEVKTALKPGAVVTYGTGSDAGVFVAAETGDNNKQLFVLGLNPMNNGGVEDAYTAGDTAIGHALVGGKRRSARMAAATYTAGQALMVTASGVLGAHNGTNRVVAHAYEAATTTSTADLAAVVAA